MQKPKNPTQNENIEALLTKQDENLKKFKESNALLRQNIRNIQLQKIENDAQTQNRNSKILNDLSLKLVSVFFKWYLLPFWILGYFVLYAYYPHFLQAIHNVGLFLLVFVLGKFLKDNFNLLINKKLT